MIDHVAAQGTAAERARYWTSKSYDSTSATKLDHNDLLTKPPTDTIVLLGFLKSAEHLARVRRTGLQPRADMNRAGAVGVEAPELTPDFVLLYDQHGEVATMFRARNLVSVRSADELGASGQTSFSQDLDR